MSNPATLSVFTLLESTYQYQWLGPTNWRMAHEMLLNFYRDAIGGTDDLPRTSGYRNVRTKSKSLHFWQSVASVLHTLLLGTVMASTCIYTYLIQGDLVARNVLRKICFCNTLHWKLLAFPSPWSRALPALTIIFESDYRCRYWEDISGYSLNAMTVPENRTQGLTIG